MSNPTRLLLTAHGRSVTINLPDVAEHIQKVIFRGRTWYELDLLESMHGRVHRGTALDIGAHIGNHTLWMAQVMGLKVVALEPNPTSFAALQTNVKINQLGKKVTALNLAAGSTSEKVKVMDLNPLNRGESFCRVDSNGTTYQTTLDALVERLQTQDLTLIKIDVEGSEIEILKGASKAIEKFKPIIYAEAKDNQAKDSLDIYMDSIGYSSFGKYARTPTYGYISTHLLPKGHSSLSVAIMAHPARQKEIPALLKRLDHPAAVVMDHHNDRWETGRRAMLAYDPKAPYHLVLQDDAVLPLDFAAGLMRILNETDKVPLCLYTGRASRFVREFNRAIGRLKVGWMKMPGINWGVGIVVLTKDIPELVAFGDQRTEPNYDLRVSRYYESKGIPVWYPVPALVNHKDIDSLVPGRVRGRHAWKFLGESRSALEVDPHSPYVTVNITR